MITLGEQNSFNYCHLNNEWRLLDFCPQTYGLTEALLFVLRVTCFHKSQAVSFT